MSNLAIEINDVSQSYPHFNLSGINLELEAGSILGLIGPNGAGKSTTIRILMGLLIPQGGSVKVLGHDMLHEAQLAKWKIGFASEDMRLYKNMSLQWHIDYMKSLFTSWDDAYVKTLVKRFDLIPEQKIKGLSHGQRVKANLLLVLARRPKLLVLDEPTTGLDPVARQETLRELMDVMVDDDRSILFSSHNTQDIEQLSDKITFIDRGKVVNSKDKETFLEEWRRLRIEIAPEKDLSSINHLVDVKRSGRVAVVTTNKYSESFIQLIKGFGASISSVESLSLEEIFIAEVFSSRGGE